jgi:hypothetical protein
MIKMLTRLGGAALVVAMASTASAATITQTESITGSFTGADTGSFSFFQTLPGFDQFTGPGTLLGVTLSWDISSDGSITVDGCFFFGDCAPASYALFLSGTNAFAAVNDSASQPGIVNVATDDEQTGFFSVRITGFQSFATLAPFIGAGQVGSLDLFGQYAGYCENCLGFKNGSVTLTYEYEPGGTVPGPATLTVLALGLTAAAARRRRKNRT